MVAFLCVDQTILPATSPILYAAVHTTLRLFSFSENENSSCLCIYLLIFSIRCELFECLVRLWFILYKIYPLPIDFYGITDSQAIKDHKHNPYYWYH